MNKFLSILLLVISSIALADTIVVTHPGPKGSQGDAEVQQVMRVVSGLGLITEAYIPGTCADSAKAWNTAGSKPMIMLYSSTWGQMERTVGKPCTADFTNSFVVQRRLTASWMCSGPNPRPFNTPGLKVGLQSSTPWQSIQDDINKKNSWSWKIVPTNQSSKEAIMQVINGDLDYHFIGVGGNGLVDKMKQGEIKCVISSMPGDQLPYMGTEFHMSGDVNKALTKNYITVVKNVKPADLERIKAVLDPSKSEETKKYFEFNDFKYRPLEVNNQMNLNDFWNHVTEGLSFYKK